MKKTETSIKVTSKCNLEMLSDKLKRNIWLVMTIIVSVCIILASIGIIVRGRDSQILIPMSVSLFFCVRNYRCYRAKR